MNYMQKWHQKKWSLMLLFMVALDGAAGGELHAPKILQAPVGRQIYAGGTLRLEIVAEGDQLKYTWSKNGSDLAGATNPVVTVDSVGPEHSGVYTARVVNPEGEAMAQAEVQVLVPTSGSYEAEVLSARPISWWRLNEAEGTGTMRDALGRHDGQYTNTSEGAVALGVAGIGGDLAARFPGTGAYGWVPYASELNTTEFTLTAWLKASPGTKAGDTAVSSRSGTQGVWLWVYPEDQWSGGASSAGGDYYIPALTDEATVEPEVWTFLAISYSPDTAMRFLVNGKWDGQGYVGFDPNQNGPLLIGARGEGPDLLPQLFYSGVIDDVALYDHALSLDQLRRQYSLGLFGDSHAPVIRREPQDLSVVAGTPVVLGALVEGSEPILTQWHKGGRPIAGATNADLSIAFAQYSDIGEYWLSATNSAGGVRSKAAKLTVSQPATFVNATNGLILHLPFDDAVDDRSGLLPAPVVHGAPAFVPGRIGAALRYSTDTTNGTYSYLRLGQPAKLLEALRGSFSVAYWIRTPPKKTGGDLPIFGNSVNSFGNKGITIAPSYDEGGWSWSLSDGENVATAFGAPGSINDGQWHHMVHSFDRAADLATTYLDGAPVNIRSIRGVQGTDSGADFSIGQDATGAYPEGGSAELDDFAVWGRALSAEEARDIHRVGFEFGAALDTYGPVKLVMFRADDSIVFVWPAGTLVEAESIDGPWTPVPGARAPNFRAPISAGAKLYRVQL